LFQKRLTYNTKGENFPVLSFFLRFCFYLFERERERRNLEGGRGRGRSKLPAQHLALHRALHRLNILFFKKRFYLLT